MEVSSRPPPSPCVCKLKPLQETEGNRVRVQLCLFEEASLHDRGLLNDRGKGGGASAKSATTSLHPTNLLDLRELQLWKTKRAAQTLNSLGMENLDQKKNTFLQ